MQSYLHCQWYSTIILMRKPYHVIGTQSIWAGWDGSPAHKIAQNCPCWGKKSVWVHVLPFFFLNKKEPTWQPCNNHTAAVPNRHTGSAGETRPLQPWWHTRGFRLQPPSLELGRLHPTGAAAEKQPAAASWPQQHLPLCGLCAGMSIEPFD